MWFHSCTFKEPEIMEAAQTLLISVLKTFSCFVSRCTMETGEAAVWFHAVLCREIFGPTRHWTVHLNDSGLICEQSNLSLSQCRASLRNCFMNTTHMLIYPACASERQVSKGGGGKSILCLQTFRGLLDCTVHPFSGGRTFTILSWWLWCHGLYSIYEHWQTS